MKKYLILFLLLSIFSSRFAIANDDESVKVYLFPQFEKGYVILKDNVTRIAAEFNYDLVEERMLYLEADNSLAELDANAVNLVVIGDRFFIPAKNKSFYEEIEVGNNAFYISHKTKLMSKGKAAGYGTYSQTSAISGLTISTNAGKSYLLGPDEKIEGIDESFICLKNGKNFTKINSLKSLVQFFKSNKAEIEAFSKEKNTNFNKIKSVKAIVEFAFSL